MHLRVQVAYYKLKGDLSPKRLKISKFTRIGMKNHSSVTG